MGIFDHTSVKTSCNSCSKTASSMGVMDGSMGAMDTMGYSMGAMGAMDGSMGAMDTMDYSMGAMGAMDGSIGTMGKYKIKKDKIGKKQKARKAEEATDNALITLDNLKKMLNEIKNDPKFASIESAKDALEKFLGGVDVASKGHLGLAIKEFLLNFAGFSTDAGGVVVRSAVLAAATSGYAVEKIARELHKAVSDAVEDAREAV